ncbi:c-type cytochrome, partial [Vibrio sp. OPT46]|uniref:c-type cytochrome n=1 Tax=Vibrio sp. OPT46 TaxID=2778645 RepID=UPI001D14D002
MLKRSFILAGMFGVSLFTYASEDSISAGESIFRTVGGYGCIACHGLYGQGGGNVGRNIRGSSLNDLKYSLEHEQ